MKTGTVNIFVLCILCMMYFFKLCFSFYLKKLNGNLESTGRVRVEWTAARFGRLIFSQKGNEKYLMLVEICWLCCLRLNRIISFENNSCYFFSFDKLLLRWHSHTHKNKSPRNQQTLYQFFDTNYFTYVHTLDNFLYKSVMY